MKRITTYVLLLLIAAAASGKDWPSWRGPGNLGVADGAEYPESWDVEKDTLWSTELPGTSTSTPIVWGDRLFLTSQIGRSPIARRGEGEDPEADDALTFVVLALDRATGREVWRRDVPSAGELPATHLKHNLASPSPVTDGDRLITWFATGQVVAFDLDGKELWQRNLAEDFGPFDIRWAHGSSPVLHEDKVFLLCEHNTAYLLALDAATGKTAWRVERESPGRSYTTPLLVERDGRPELIVNATQNLQAYDPATGDELWRVGQPIRVPVSTPVFADGVLYTSRGYRSGPYMAVDLDGAKGDISETHTLWRVATGAPYVSSLLHYNGIVFMATEAGVASAIDATSGKTLWRERLGGNFSASPVAADGKVYLANEEGEFFVIAADKEYRLISQTSLDEGLQATPVLVEGHIYLRSAAKLYAF
ncbi:MAG: PQQ-binding-like beta-propeller repeat protein [Acidobacteriota bacterium]